MDFYIMSRDSIVAKWQSGKIEILDEALLPLYLKITSNAEKWLAKRAIDHRRANARLLKKALHLVKKDDISTVITVNAATITDSYGLNP